MNTIVTLKRLVELVAKEAGCDQATAESFLKAFTAQVRDGLAEGEEVKVKGIGTFVASANKISCIVDPELSAAVNEPFAMFDAEEIPADLEEESLQNAAEIAQEAAEQQPEAAKVPEAEPTNNREGEEEKKEEPSAPVTNEAVEAKEVEEAMDAIDARGDVEAKDAIEAGKPEESNESNDADEPKNAVETKETEEDKAVIDDDEELEEPAVEEAEQPTLTRPATFWLVWAAVIGLIVGFLAGFLIHDPIERLLEPSLAEEQSLLEEEESELEADLALLDSVVQPVDSVKPVEATPDTVPNSEVHSEVPVVKDEPAVKQEVTDHIRNGYTLAKMAKKHYGANEYWVYIYYENKDRIKNPNRIDIGTELRIPPIEKYATQATEDERRAAARKKVGEVLAKYPN